MKTRLKTIHEEEYSDKSRILGILINYSIDDTEFDESFIYVYRKGIYIFFNTIIDMIDYLLYGNDNMKRAYFEEDEFDKYYDSDYIVGKFSDLLVWQ